MIKLTGLYTRESIYICPENLTFFNRYGAGDISGSILRFVCRTEITVKETPEEIYNLIHPKPCNTGPR